MLFVFNGLKLLKWTDSGNDIKLTNTKSVDPGRTRTCNPLIRSQMPYPLGHRANVTNVGKFYPVIYTQRTL